MKKRFRITLATALGACALAIHLVATPALAQEPRHSEPEEAPVDQAEKHDHTETEARAVDLSPEVLREFDIEVRTADRGSIARTVRLPGEVVFNADQVVRVMPTVLGITDRIDVSVGDRVEEGQVLAVLHSRELAEARSAYLAAEARIQLAEENLERDQRLFEQKVGTEKAVQQSRQALRDAQITLSQADDALHALGETHENITELEHLGDGGLNAYLLVSPIEGVVTERNLTLGEVIEPTGPRAPFVVADLSTVWVNLTVYQRDLVHVRSGQPVSVEFGHGIPDAQGVIDFVSPSLDETTRTATARVVLENPDRHWRPGLFVDGTVETGLEEAEVVIPHSAVIGLDGRDVVFVETDEGFVPRPVRVGSSTPHLARILEGLAPGERYAATNVLTLKAQLESGTLEHAGHAH